jgi:hypothetical protein
MPRLIDPAKKAQYLQHRQLGYTQAESARRAGITYTSARGIENRNVGVKASLRIDGLQKPIALKHLTRAPKRALNDIGYFARRYYGMILLPFHYEDTERVTEWASTPQKEFTVINIAPGTGKTTFYTRVLPAWLTCRDRRIRGMVGSASHGLAARYVRQLRSDFTRTIPVQANSTGIEQGWAVDARACLVQDYGRFRPDNASEDTIWRQDNFIVDQIDAVSVSEKESTWQAFGPDSSVIGTRVNFAVWDDLYDVQKFRSRETKQSLYDWWSNTAEERLEPNGLLLLVGQRLAADDIYHYALNQKRLSPDGAIIPKYHHIVHKAHYDELCRGAETHTFDAEPWPVGCLLFPKRVTWTEVSDKKLNRPDVFEVVYQQNDYIADDQLVKRVWVDGGTDPDTGEKFDGCWDEDRDICEYPHGLTPPLYSMATVDPAPSNFWAIEWWLYHPDSETRYLLDIFHGKQGGNDLLDWVNADQKFAGLMEDWQTRSLTLGIPISHWIVEINAAQKFLLQYEHVKRWARLREVQIVPHTTGINKSNSDLGVTTIASKYKYGQVRLPARTNEAKRKSERLVADAVNFRKDFSHSTPDDCVMAQWFLEFNLPRLAFRGIEVAQQSRPAWVSEYFRPHYQQR